MELVVMAFLGVAALFVYAITRGTDASMQAKGEDTPAPEWARALFVLVVVGLLFACLGPGLLR
jgi:hypothetical protein